MLWRGAYFYLMQPRCLNGVRACAALSQCYQWDRLADLKPLPSRRLLRMDLHEEMLLCWRLDPGALATGLSPLHAALDRRTPGSDMLALMV